MVFITIHFYLKLTVCTFCVLKNMLHIYALISFNFRPFCVFVGGCNFLDTLTYQHKIHSS
jgi:hypothetical protein